MRVRVKIRLTKPLLGGNRDTRNNIRRFKKQGSDILIPQKMWMRSFHKAAEDLRLKCNVNRIQLMEGIRQPTIHAYSRRWNRIQVEHFESIRKGTVLTFELYLRNHEASAPEIKEVARILEEVGANIGISEFGNHFGYGRFEVVSIKKASGEA